MKSRPAIHPQEVTCHIFPHFRNYHTLKEKKKLKFSTLALLLFVFLQMSHLILKQQQRSPGNQDRKMQCHLWHGWLQRNRSLEHGCAISTLFKPRRLSQTLPRTVPRESQLFLQGLFLQGSAVSEHRRDDGSGLTQT